MAERCNSVGVPARSSSETHPELPVVASSEKSAHWAGLFHLSVVYLVWSSTYLAIRVAVREGSGFPHLLWWGYACWREVLCCCYGRPAASGAVKADLHVSLA